MSPFKLAVTWGIEGKSDEKKSSGSVLGFYIDSVTQGPHVQSYRSVN